MKNTIVVNKQDLKVSRDELKALLKNHKFKLIQDKADYILFSKPDSIFELWKANPLNWNSKIEIKYSDPNIEIKLNLKNSNDFNSTRAILVLTTFAEELKSFLKTGDFRNDQLQRAIQNSRKFWWQNNLVAVLCLLFCALITLALKQIGNFNNYWILILIPILTAKSYKMIMNYFENKCVV